MSDACSGAAWLAYGLGLVLHDDMPTGSASYDTILCDLDLPMPVDIAPDFQRIKHAYDSSFLTVHHHQIAATIHTVAHAQEQLALL